VGGEFFMSKHRKTFEAMQGHPAPANLRWSDVESLLVYLGAKIVEGRGSAITVTLKGKKAWFHRPHPEDKADRGAIKNALILIKESGAEKKLEVGNGLC
jgi:hypothetical protein